MEYKTTSSSRNGMKDQMYNITTMNKINNSLEKNSLNIHIITSTSIIRNIINSKQKMNFSSVAGIYEIACKQCLKNISTIYTWMYTKYFF